VLSQIVKVSPITDTDGSVVTYPPGPTDTDGSPVTDTSGSIVTYPPTTSTS